MTKKRKNHLSEEGVAKFWDQNEATDVLDLSPPKRVELVYRPPVQSISLRLPVPLLTRIRNIASSMDIAYQALIKTWLAEKVKRG